MNLVDNLLIKFSILKTPFRFYLEVDIFYAHKTYYFSTTAKFLSIWSLIRGVSFNVVIKKLTNMPKIFKYLNNRCGLHRTLVSSLLIYESGLCKRSSDWPNIWATSVSVSIE